MNKSELMPCPFCGEQARCYPSNAFSESGFQFIVQCEGVDNHTLVNDYRTEAEAIAAWNKRVKRYPESLAQRMIADGYEYELFTLRKECDKLKADMQAEKESNINTKLTVDQVRKCVLVVYYEGYNDGYLNRGSHYEETDWQAITDELNATRTLAG